ncbi:DUF3006 domain-containing protein [Patescibacteria group bacterium]|nr:DUF3006 domain-containing protein [Patescibacteria group bacterium]
MEGTIDRTEGDHAVIIMKNHQLIYWPKENLPKKCIEGITVIVSIEIEETNTKDKENLAKEFLNKIIDN